MGVTFKVTLPRGKARKVQTRMKWMLKRFCSWCKPKSGTFRWFSLKENHSSRSLSGHSNCKTAFNALLLTVLVPAYCPLRAQGVDNSMLLDPPADSWPLYHGAYNGQIGRAH